MGQDTAAYDEVLKVYYEGGIRELIPTKTKVLKMFENRDTKEWGGQGVEYPAVVGRTEGAGWGSELGALPAPGKMRYTRWRIPMRYMYGSISLSAQVMKASQGSKFAFASAMRQEMDGIVSTLQANRGRAIMSDGRGILAFVNGTSTGTTVTVDSPAGVAGATNGTRFIRPGMVLAAINPATGDIRASTIHTVSSVASTGLTYTATAAVAGITDNDYLVQAMHTGVTGVGDTSYQKEITGLMGLVDDGTNLLTLHNVNRTSFPITQSYVLNVSGALSADVMQKAIDVGDQRGDGETADLIMHHSVRRAYIAMTDNDRRYQGGDLMKPDAGTVAAKRGQLTFGGIGITEEKYSPYGTIFGIDRSGFSRYVEVAGEWVDEDGAILCRIGTGTSGTDAFEARYRIWDEFHNDYAARCWRLDGITAQVAVVHVD